MRSNRAAEEVNDQFEELSALEGHLYWCMQTRGSVAQISSDLTFEH